MHSGVTLHATHELYWHSPSDAWVCLSCGGVVRDRAKKLKEECAHEPANAEARRVLRDVRTAEPLRHLRSAGARAGTLVPAMAAAPMPAPAHENTETKWYRWKQHKLLSIQNKHDQQQQQQQ